jgi:flagellar basal-body rod protein FlgG
MEAALWVAKTGLDAQQTRMTVIANNLANVNTTGFKRDRATFEDLLYQSVRQGGAQTSADTAAPTGLLLGTGTRIVATEKLHAQGNLIQTQNAFDMAISGEGFFQILQPDGTLAYTRDGGFKISAEGVLVNSSGYPAERANDHDWRGRDRFDPNVWRSTSSDDWANSARSFPEPVWIASDR